MFLKIATVLAILGLLLSLLLTLIQQILSMGFLRLENLFMIFRFLNLGEALSVGVPLLIFFVAFLLDLNARKS